MMIFQMFVPLLFVFWSFQYEPASKADDNPLTSETICLSPFEVALYEELNAYRAEYQLPAISLSPSLTLVAQLHCRDLVINKPNDKEKCNMHSWSHKGSWSGCCYTADHKQSKCMWDKPGELTNYRGDGFEIAFYSTAYYPDASAFAKDAIKNWSQSTGHNEVILNRGIWKKLEWKAVGVGVYGEYATIWFGKVDDPDTTAIKPCE